MELLDRIKNNIERIAGLFAESPSLCSFFSCLFGIATICCIRFLVCGLLEMHRSRSKLKKIRKDYSFAQKIVMKHAWNECLHAKNFCRFLIIFHHFRIILLCISLLLAILANAIPSLMRTTASVSACVYFCIDMPALLFHVALDRHPFQRYKHAYRFEKYHNTQNHHSLF